MSKLFGAIDKVLKAVPTALLKKCSRCEFKTCQGKYTWHLSECIHEDIITIIAYILPICTVVILFIGAISGWE